MAATTRLTPAPPPEAERRGRPKAGQDELQCGQRGVDIGLRGFRPERDAQRAVREMRIDAHGEEHVARLGAAGGAGAAGRGLDTLQVERRDEIAALHAIDHDADVVGEPILRVPRERHAIEREQANEEARAQTPEPIGFGGPRLGVGVDQGEGAAESDDAGHVLGAGAPLPLLRPALQLRQQLRPATHEQGANALGPTELVRREADEVCLPGVDVDRLVGGQLHRVHVESRRVPAHDLADCRDRLTGPDLVVGGHDAHQCRPLGQRRGDVDRVDAAVSVHRQDGDVEAAPFEDGDRIEDRLVLDRGGDDMPSAPGRRPRQRP